MAGKVTYKVVMTPYTTISGSANNYDEHDVVNLDIGKRLSATADVAVDTTNHTTVGYGTASAGTVAYGNAAVSGGTALTLGSAGYDFVYIKHTGYQYGSDATTLGGAVSSTTNLVVTIGSQIICNIPPEGAIALPNIPAADIKVQSTHAGETIAVEYALIT